MPTLKSPWGDERGEGPVLSGTELRVEESQDNNRGKAVVAVA